MQAMKKAGDRKGFLAVRSRVRRRYVTMRRRREAPRTMARSRSNRPPPASRSTARRAQWASLPAPSRRCLRTARRRCIPWRACGHGRCPPAVPSARAQSPQILETDTDLELSLQFLRAKDDLIWVEFVRRLTRVRCSCSRSIKSPHDILMSMCIRSMIEEIVRLKRGEPVRVPGDRKRHAVPRRSPGLIHVQRSREPDPQGGPVCADHQGDGAGLSVRLFCCSHARITAPQHAAPAAAHPHKPQCGGCRGPQRAQHARLLCGQGHWLLHVCTSPPLQCTSNGLAQLVVLCRRARRSERAQGPDARSPNALCHDARFTVA